MKFKEWYEMTALSFLSKCTLAVGWNAAIKHGCEKPPTNTTIATICDTCSGETEDGYAQDMGNRYCPYCGRKLFKELTSNGIPQTLDESCSGCNGMGWYRVDGVNRRCECCQPQKDKKYERF